MTGERALRLIEGPCLFLSDLHLNGGPRDQAPLTLLRRAASGALGVELKHVFLVGDLFDFHLGYPSAPYPHLSAAYELLYELADRGLQLWVFTGNHDPDPCPHLARHPRIELLTEPSLFELSRDEGEPLRLLLEHGDLCEEAWLKRALCRLVRARWLCALARLLPPGLALALAPRLPERLNQLRSPQAARPTAALEHASRRQLAHSLSARLSSLKPPELRPQLWVMGHFHEAKLTRLMPERDELRAQVELLILGDWVRLNTCALLCGSELSLYQFDLSREVELELLLSHEL